MRLFLINPSNPYVNLVKIKESRWNRYRVWKPLSLLVLAGLTPSEWEISVFDENMRVPDYNALPLPDLVGITAFTSQAVRCYELAAHFQNLGVPVVMGGIHATMCVGEAVKRVNTIVTGEGEGVWREILEDAKNGTLKQRYDGKLAEMGGIPLARHDLLPTGYAFGAIQTTRGCPLNCNFCSVTAFNGAHYRQRPIPEVIAEFQSIREKYVLIVDDNLIGTRHEHIARAKDLFRAMIGAKLKKEWIAQTTINLSDDEELMALASKAGCRGVFIGFESPTPEGLMELGKRFNLSKGRDFRASVKRIQRHRISVVGSFIIGLDVDRPGIGQRVAEAARHYGLDNLNALFLTPLPGTKLWDHLTREGRVTLNNYPADWTYYTLTYPVVRHEHLSLSGIIQEMESCDRNFYSAGRIMQRVWGGIRQRRSPLMALFSNLSYRSNCRRSGKAYKEFELQQRTSTT